MHKHTLIATLYMIGTIVGAGIFGVPYVMSVAGIPIGIAYLVLLGGAILLTHGFYARIVAETEGRHRLAGITRARLGMGAAHLVSVTTTVELFGALLAYIILGGSFLSTLFGGDMFLWSVGFFVVMGFVLMMPFMKAQYVMSLLTWMMLFMALAMVALIVHKVQPAAFISYDLKKWFVPYGVIFFAMGGLSGVPDIVDSLRKDARASVRAAHWGTALAVLVTAVFGVVIASVSRGATSQNAVSGLVPFVGEGIVFAGAVFGLFAVATSFIAFGNNLREQMQFDFKVPHVLALALTLGIPLAAYLLGARNFIHVIGFIGAFFGVVNGIVVGAMAWKLPNLRFRWAIPPIILLFVAGFLAQVLTLKQ